jgi:hypothetical protein
MTHLDLYHATNAELDLELNILYLSNVIRGFFSSDKEV